MMKIILLVLALTVAAHSYRQVLTGTHYQGKSSNLKLSQVYSMINHDTRHHGHWYCKIRQGELFLQDNEKAFKYEADDMPDGMVAGTLRPKLIHSVGLTATVSFTSKGNHPYTGIFKGADNGILRLSLASKPEDKTIIPGFVFKFFRDDQPSANIFSMYGLEGQRKNSNVFAHDMTTHIPMLNNHAPLPLKLLAKNFYTISDYPNHLGFSFAAEFDQQGNKEQNVEFPWRLVFHPTQKANQSMKSDLKMREYFFLDAMQDLHIEHLFEVYAQATPENEELQYIGDIRMRSPFTKSTFGDEKLYFQHQKFEDDLKYRPEWEEAIEKLNDQQASYHPQYYYPDIGYDTEKIVE